MEKKSMEEDDHRHGKKRKMNETEEKEENHDEEEAKMEEFFALIRSTREVRDRLRDSGLIDDQKKEEKIKKDDDNNNNQTIKGKEIGVWNPTFIPEDFLDGDKKISALPLPLPDSVVVGSTSQLLDHHIGASKMEVEEEEDIVKEDDTGGKDNNNDNNLDLELSL